MPMPFSALIRQIRRRRHKLQGQSDAHLREQSLLIKYEAMSGTPLEKLIPAGFSLISEVVRRQLSMTYYDVQLACGIYLVQGRIAEMKTGEGKTITAALPVFLHALTGRGAHVATVNDYLAKRDCELLRPVFESLGLSVGAVTGDLPADGRSHNYRKDITYGSAKEFGFDFLRDRLKALKFGGNARPEMMTMRGLSFALVDEADSILIDEARTPLIIGLIDKEEEQIRRDCFTWASEFASDFVEDEDFTYDVIKRKVELTFAGRSRLRGLRQNKGSRQVSILELYEFMENGIKVRRDFKRDRNYAVIDGKIVIIDEFTGRPAEGRQWQGGIHQSVEAREGIEITPATQQAARVTVQNFFRKYQNMAGMTGTAITSRKEFAKVYKKKVFKVPTHRPVRRKQLPVQIYSDFDKKMNAVVQEVQQMTARNRAVLVGTRSVERSEALSQRLREKGIAHQVLNASHLDREAQIVSAAGEPGIVTVATNMAGRGTDIKLHETVRRQGGLHVILTEIHESARIDWQLIGRGSRQGDPGSYRIFVALDDEILETGLGKGRARRLQKKYAASRGIPRNVFLFFRVAQKRVERKHLVDRMILLRQDKERQEQLFDTGQDPHLDLVE